MSRASTMLAAAALTVAACVDFDQAKAQCEARGDCQTSVAAVQLQASTPANAATDVAVGTLVRVSFSLSMDKSSVQLVPAPSIELGAARWNTDDTEVTYQPSQPLLNGGHYTIGVTGRAVSGGELPLGTQFAFTTEPVRDTTAPTLVATVPVDLSLSPGSVTPADTRLQLTFSEAMDQQAGVLTVAAVPAHDFGSVTWSADGTVARFAASPALQFDTTYALTIDGKDVAGNALSGSKTLSFKTGGMVDSVAPTIVSTTPTSASTEVALLATPVIVFSEAMRPGSVTGAVTILPAVGGFACMGDASSTTFTCTHTQPFDPFATYAVTVGTGALDVAGNALAQPELFSFSTVTPPSIVGTSPDGGSLGLPLRPTIRVTFSEPMDQPSVESAFSIVQPAATPAGTFAWDGGSEFNYALAADLTYGQDVLYRVAATAKDLQGNGLPAGQDFTFKVRRQLSATLTPDNSGAFDDVNVLSNGTVYGGTSSTAIAAGDIYSGADYVVRGLFSFNLAPPSLDPTVLEVLSASLVMRHGFSGGAVFSQNASIFMHTLNITTAGGFAADYAGAFNATPICTRGTVQCLTASCYAKLVVSAASATPVTLPPINVVNDVRALLLGRRVSFRLERLVDPAKAGTVTCAALGAIANSSNDNVYLNSSGAGADKPVLTISYTAP